MACLSAKLFRLKQNKDSGKQVQPGLTQLFSRQSSGLQSCHLSHAAPFIRCKLEGFMVLVLNTVRQVEPVQLLCWCGVAIGLFRDRWEFLKTGVSSVIQGTLCVLCGLCPRTYFLPSSPVSSSLLFAFIYVSIEMGCNWQRILYSLVREEKCCM